MRRRRKKTRTTYGTLKFSGFLRWNLSRQEGGRASEMVCYGSDRPTRASFLATRMICICNRVRSRQGRQGGKKAVVGSVKITNGSW
ncbi:hypothetical protein GWI33_008467 [Rhynchophorus ferrugineus]|uniref:Uncharacterized protein n=1 Tax=Rhynchophorus ferrugineus TaxID=354439 RepID=A0A834IER8_RHYFE|nr:hypothetical protein GWI33_008467 [Rhynchophorus ferrugineus]